MTHPNPLAHPFLGSGSVRTLAANLYLGSSIPLRALFAFEYPIWPPTFFELNDNVINCGSIIYELSFWGLA